MTRCTGLSFVMLAALLAAPARPRGQAPDKDETPVVALAPQGARRAAALAYRLLPDPLDAVEGNAASLWLRAIAAARAVEQKWTEKEWAWDHPGARGTALKDLPRAQVRAALAAYGPALRLAEQAARRTRCDWERDPLTLQNLADPHFLPLDEVQGLRELIRLVSLRCRLELSEDRFADAARSLQVGFAMARHLNSGDLIIQDLVAVALASIMLGRVEEWVQRPGSPNLYWALTELPRPLVDTRKSIRHELNTVHRSFPAFRQMRTRRFTDAEATRTLAELMRYFGAVVKPKEQAKLSMADYVKARLPEAKKALVAAGRTEKDLDAMPAAQVVALAYIDDYDRKRDDISRWLSVPTWQAREPLAKLLKAWSKTEDKGAGVVLAMLLPAVSKVLEAQNRADRFVAGLRGAEALRQHVAQTGQVPAKWSDLTAVPGPIDPYTGKGLDDFYSAKGGKGVLALPPPPGMPATLGRRYEVGVKS